MTRHTIIGLRVLPGGRVGPMSASPSSGRRPHLFLIRGGRDADEETNRNRLKNKLESIVDRLRQVEGLLHAVSRLDD